MPDQWEIEWHDYYEILQISSKAEPEVVEAAHKGLSKKYHPDRPHADLARMQLINLARGVLMSPTSRRQYDKAYIQASVAKEAVELLRVAASRVAARRGFPEPDRGLVPVNDRPCEAVIFRFSDSTHLYLLAHPWFPELPPFVIVRWGDGVGPTRPVPVNWERDGEIADRLDAALAAFVAHQCRGQNSSGLSPSSMFHLLRSGRLTDCRE
jgi:hypothetical protein